MDEARDDVEREVEQVGATSRGLVGRARAGGQPIPPPFAFDAKPFRSAQATDDCGLSTTWHFWLIRCLLAHHTRAIGASFSFTLREHTCVLLIAHLPSPHSISVITRQRFFSGLCVGFWNISLLTLASSQRSAGRARASSGRCCSGQVSLSLSNDAHRNGDPFLTQKPLSLLLVAVSRPSGL